MQQHLSVLNQAGIRKGGKFKPVSPHELVRFWGTIITTRQFSQRGKDLWNTNSQGLLEPPNFGKYMKEWRFAQIRRLIQDMLTSSPSDPWAKFRPMVASYNANRHDRLCHDGDCTFDESMSSWQPRKTKLGGLPNISFVKRKPKPLGTEFKTVCDTESGVMKYMEIQEGLAAEYVGSKCKQKIWVSERSELLRTRGVWENFQS